MSAATDKTNLAELRRTMTLWHNRVTALGFDGVSDVIALAEAGGDQMKKAWPIGARIALKLMMIKQIGEGSTTANSLPHVARIADEALECIRQRPAAQDDDGVLLPRRLAATQKLKQLGYHYDAAQGQWLPTQPAAQATPEPDEVARLVASIKDDAKHAAYLAEIDNTDGRDNYLHKLSISLDDLASRVQHQATPEPAQPRTFDDRNAQFREQNWQIRFDAAVDARRLAQEQLYSERERHTAEVKRLQLEIGRLTATPEPVGEAVAWLRKTDITELVDTEPEEDGWTPLFTSPAPGVPEGFVLVPLEPTWEMRIAASTAYREARDGHYTARMEQAADCWRIMLAAAQAKGGDPEDLAAAGVMLMGKGAGHA